MKIFNTNDAFIAFDLEMPTGKTWNNYASVKIQCWNKGVLLQTNGYPAQHKEDIQLVVPDVSKGLCYFKLDKNRINARLGLLQWRVISSENDAEMSDSSLDLEDRITRFRLED